MNLELDKTPLALADFIRATAARSDAMRQALDAAREADFLQEQCAARGIAFPPQRLTMKMIAVAVAAKYGLTLEEICSDDRRRCVAAPRQEAMWLMRQEKTDAGALRYSLPQIGRFFGGRDHTTALHGVRRHEQRLADGAREAAA